ncbi:hypothetical protein ASA1KI_43980 [Opitutales bacterium ASA1]|uniref:hypothetical protein n=1 Tax=Congregicoccus parvus TaxID=3081749 RepID=UPI002B2ADB3B|nr:hypothetical protein ASA1KI_43980 [Opitutales bacterium ASA1]
MPSRPKQTPAAPAVKGRRLAAKSEAAAPAVNRQRIDETGLTTRIRGHVSARGKRVQAKRDARE